MGICADEFRDWVIRPTLEQLQEWSPAAENLLIGTAMQETGLGFHLKTTGDRGLGIFHISPTSHIRVWDQYLIHHPDLASRIRGLASQREFLSHPHSELATNLSYATAIAWMMYRRVNRPLPAAEDISALGELWVRYYPPRTQGRISEFEANYQRLFNREENGLAA